MQLHKRSRYRKMKTRAYISCVRSLSDSLFFRVHSFSFIYATFLTRDNQQALSISRQRTNSETDRNGLPVFLLICSTNANQNLLLGFVGTTIQLERWEETLQFNLAIECKHEPACGMTLPRSSCSCAASCKHASVHTGKVHFHPLLMPFLREKLATQPAQNGHFCSKAPKQQHDAGEVQPSNKTNYSSSPHPSSNMMSKFF